MKEEMSFEVAMKRLEEIVATLEEGSVSLDASLAAYEEGVALVRLCQDKLNDAEARILQVQDTGADASFVPFHGGNE